MLGYQTMSGISEVGTRDLRGKGSATARPRLKPRHASERKSISFLYCSKGLVPTTKADKQKQRRPHRAKNLREQQHYKHVIFIQPAFWLISWSHWLSMKDYRPSRVSHPCAGHASNSLFSCLEAKSKGNHHKNCNRFRNLPVGKGQVGEVQSRIWCAV